MTSSCAAPTGSCHNSYRSLDRRRLLLGATPEVAHRIIPRRRSRAVTETS